MVPKGTTYVLGYVAPAFVLARRSVAPESMSTREDAPGGPSGHRWELAADGTPIVGVNHPGTRVKGISDTCGGECVWSGPPRVRMDGPAATARP